MTAFPNETEARDGIIFLGVVLALVFGVTALAELFPNKRIFGWRNVFLAGLTLCFVALTVLARIRPSERDIVELTMPLHGDVLVVQGGQSPLVNHHFTIRAQRHAVDLAMMKNGRWLNGEAKDRASYGCFGSPVYAPLAGVVAKVVQDLPELAVGEFDVQHPVGNHVVLHVAEDRFLLFAHLKQGSARVREGDSVACGDVLADH